MNRVFLLAAFAVLLVAGCKISGVFANDFNPNDTAIVEIWVKHDLGFVTYRVPAICWFQSGTRWYIKAPDGVDYWSDKEPQNVEGDKSEKGRCR